MAQPTPISSYSLDDLFQSMPLGSIDQAQGNNIYGINHRQVPGVLPQNRDTYGLTFFTRPQLNLQSNNIRNTRILYNLLNTNNKSIQACTKALLDPRLINGYGKGASRVPPYICPIVDPLNCFIPVLTNNLISITGWSDIALDSFTSKEGLYKETYSQVDSLARNYTVYEVDATFRNTKGDLIFSLIFVWLHYMSMVYEGLLLPYPDFLTENEIDYNTRIYRLILDQQKQVVTKIVAADVAYPITLQAGQFFDFNVEKPYNDQNKEINVRFKCMGYEPMDGVLIYEFNKCVEQFNPNMENGFRDNNMIKLTSLNASMFNNRGYPRINPNNYKLEWYVDKLFYNNRSYAFLQQNIAANQDLIAYENTGD